MLCLQHLASFLAAARSRVAHRALASLALAVRTSQRATRDATAEARSASDAARRASAEAVSAQAGAAAAASAIRKEMGAWLEQVLPTCGGQGARATSWLVACIEAAAKEWAAPGHHASTLVPIDVTSSTFASRDMVFGMAEILLGVRLGSTSSWLRPRCLRISCPSRRHMQPSVSTVVTPTPWAVAATGAGADIAGDGQRVGQRQERSRRVRLGRTRTHR